MSEIKEPASRQPILPWAIKATQEIKSLKPTAGNGLRVIRTNNGTSFSLNENTTVRPDSSPAVIAGQLSGGNLPEGAFPTTYSVEKNEQNAFSLFGFNKLNENQYHYSLEELSTKVDFSLRDTTSANTILSCPTLRYDNVLCLLVNAVTENDLSGNNPIRDALSVTVDSEQKNNIVSKSIYHNSNNELALYHFEKLNADDIEHISLSDDVVDKKILIRVKKTLSSETGSDVVPVLKYADVSSFYMPERLVQFTSELMKNESGLITGLRVYVADKDSGVMINSVNIMQGGGPVHIKGWNVFPGATELYLNIVFAQGAPGNLVSPTNIGDNIQGFVWNITPVMPAQRVYSIKLCEIVNNELIIHHEGSVEVGAMIPDSADAAPVGVALTKSLEYAGNNNNLGPVSEQALVSNTGLRLYGFQPRALNTGIGCNEGIMEWLGKILNGQKSGESLALLYRDMDDGHGAVDVDKGVLKYLPLGILDYLIVVDADRFLFGAGLSRSLQTMSGQETLTNTYGTRLYEFYEYVKNQDGAGYHYEYPVNINLSEISANTDILIRKRHQIAGVPTLGYVPLSNFLSSSSGGYPLDGETDIIGRSLNLNSENEAQIYGFEEGRPVANSLANREFIVRRPIANRPPRVEYAPLSTVISEISAVISPTQGYTGNVKYVLSSSYSTTTHKFINHVATMSFENGVLKSNETTRLEEQEVFTAVEEEL